MRVALDTNVLAYAEGLGDVPRCRRANELIEALPAVNVLIPVQVLGELHRVLSSKAGLTVKKARDAALSWADAFEVVDSSWSAMAAAFDLVADHRMQIWDALILSVAAEHKCRLLVTEDLHDGFTWHGVTVVNPFAASRNPLLASLCSED